MMNNYDIKPLLKEHWDQVADIYRQGLATGNATFETAAPEWDKWNQAHLQHSRFVARNDETTLGWAALSPVSDRCVYGGVAEVSVYVGENGRGIGIGTELLLALIKSSEENNIWTLQAGIFPENIASVNLHLKNGFREVGRRVRVGILNGTWRDTVLLERRSAIVGID